MLSLLGSLIFLYGTLVVALFAFQRRVLFVPGARRPDPRGLPANLPRPRVVDTRTEDGLVLEGWWFAPREGMPSLLYFQGNAGHVGMRADKAAMLVDRGFGVLLAGYRGYGGNPGRPSEEGLLLDARAWVDRISALGVADTDLVLYGESLGSGVVAQLALERPARAVVLEAPYTSITDIAAERYWFVPVRWLLLDRFETKRIISDIKAPILILHGSNDRLIEPSHGEALYAAASAPKRLVLVEGSGHTNLFASGAVEPLADFILDPPRG